LIDGIFTAAASAAAAAAAAAAVMPPPRLLLPPPRSRDVVTAAKITRALQLRVGRQTRKNVVNF
jgi:hypothetical protein